MTETGWNHRLSGEEFEQTPRGSERQGSLACCSPWGRKEADMTKQQQQQRTAKLESGVPNKGQSHRCTGNRVQIKKNTSP